MIHVTVFITDFLMSLIWAGVWATAWAAGGFALAAVGAVLVVNEGKVTQARVAMMGVGDTPLRCPGAELALVGQAMSEDVLDRAVEAACAPLEPNRDLHASPEYRKHLASVLCRRVLRTAWARSGDFHE